MRRIWWSPKPTVVTRGVARKHVSMPTRSIMQAVLQKLQQLEPDIVAAVLDELQANEQADQQAGIHLSPPLAIPPQLAL